MGVELEFMECSLCADKTGTPYLCPSCVNNRHFIEILKEHKKSIAEKYIDAMNLVGETDETVEILRKLLKEQFDHTTIQALQLQVLAKEVDKLTDASYCDVCPAKDLCVVRTDEVKSCVDALIEYSKKEALKTDIPTDGLVSQWFSGNGVEVKRGVCTPVKVPTQKYTMPNYDYGFGEYQVPMDKCKHPSLFVFNDESGTIPVKTESCSKCGYFSFSSWAPGGEGLLKRFEELAKEAQGKR